MRKYIFGIGIVILLLVVSGCGTDPEVQLAELSRNTVVYDEIVRLNNCGGKGDSDHTATREFATTIEFGAGISAGYKSIVEGNIAAKYSEYRNTSKSLRVVAPPGTNMEFVLRWSDDVQAGNVQVNGKNGTYEVRIPVSVEQISSRDLGCATSGQQFPPTSEVTLVEVFSDQGWQDSTVTLTQGQRFLIEYASGRWTYWAGTLAPFDANGYNYICTAVSCCEPLPRERKGALIGKIGNQVFFIGNGGSFTAGANGVLQLRINDCDHNLGDNTGSVIVRITR